MDTSQDQATIATTSTQKTQHSFTKNRFLATVILALLLLPVGSAYSLSGTVSVIPLLSALVSASLAYLLYYGVLQSVSSVWLRRLAGAGILWLLCTYYAAQLISYYSQGQGINQQFFFHFNLTTLVETWDAFYPIFGLFVVWLLILQILNWILASNIDSRQRPVLVYLATIALVIGADPGLRTASAYFVFGISGDSIEMADIDWDQLQLNQASIENQGESLSSGKNLVMIFMEGLESIYTDGNLFPELTPNLNRYKTLGWTLANMRQIKGSEWTMGGIVSSLCGTPLLYGGVMSGNNIMSTGFLDKARCLPDVLADAGYQQTFMGGASLQFAGKGTFLGNHNFDKTLGRQELVSALDDAKRLGGWGLYDQDLFALAEQEFKRLSATGKPFNLTLLTVDTHHPSGEPSPDCPKYSHPKSPAVDNLILNAVHCTDYLVNQFVTNIQTDPAFENTAVVLLSDHLAMPNSVSHLFSSQFNRGLYFTLLNTEHHGAQNIVSSPLDVAPSVLEALGVDSSVSFLAGQNLLTESPQTVNVNLNSPSRINAIRYLNQNFLSSTDRQTFYTISDSPINAFTFLNDIENARFIHKKLTLDATGNDPYFLFPSVTISSDSDVYLFSEIQSDVSAGFEIFYKLEADSNYSESRKQSFSLKPGMNQIILKLDKAAFENGLRIDPGTAAGRYTIHSFEVRG